MWFLSHFGYHLWVSLPPASEALLLGNVVMCFILLVKPNGCCPFLITILRVSHTPISDSHIMIMSMSSFIPIISRLWIITVATPFCCLFSGYLKLSLTLSRNYFSLLLVLLRVCQHKIRVSGSQNRDDTRRCRSFVYFLRVKCIRKCGKNLRIARKREI